MGQPYVLRRPRRRRVIVTDNVEYHNAVNDSITNTVNEGKSQKEEISGTTPVGEVNIKKQMHLDEQVEKFFKKNVAEMTETEQKILQTENQIRIDLCSQNDRHVSTDSNSENTSDEESFPKVWKKNQVCIKRTKQKETFHVQETSHRETMAVKSVETHNACSPVKHRETPHGLKSFPRRHSAPDMYDILLQEPPPLPIEPPPSSPPLPSPPPPLQISLSSSPPLQSPVLEPPISYFDNVTMPNEANFNTPCLNFFDMIDHNTVQKTKQINELDKGACRQLEPGFDYKRSQEDITYQKDVVLLSSNNQKIQGQWTGSLWQEPVSKHVQRPAQKLPLQYGECGFVISGVSAASVICDQTKLFDKPQQDLIYQDTFSLEHDKNDPSLSEYLSNTPETMQNISMLEIKGSNALIDDRSKNFRFSEQEEILVSKISKTSGNSGKDLSTGQVSQREIIASEISTPTMQASTSGKDSCSPKQSFQKEIITGEILTSTMQEPLVTYGLFKKSVAHGIGTKLSATADEFHEALNNLDAALSSLNKYESDIPRSTNKSYTIRPVYMQTELDISKPSKKIDAKALMDEEKEKYREYKADYVRRLSGRDSTSGTSGDEKSRESIDQKSPKLSRPSSRGTVSSKSQWQLLHEKSDISGLKSPESFLSEVGTDDVFEVTAKGKTLTPPTRNVKPAIDGSNDLRVFCIQGTKQNSDSKPEKIVIQTVVEQLDASVEVTPPIFTITSLQPSLDIMTRDENALMLKPQNDNAISAKNVSETEQLHVTGRESAFGLTAMRKHHAQVKNDNVFIEKPEKANVIVMRNVLEQDNRVYENADHTSATNIHSNLFDKALVTKTESSLAFPFKPVAEQPVRSVSLRSSQQNLLPDGRIFVTTGNRSPLPPSESPYYEQKERDRKLCFDNTGSSSITSLSPVSVSDAGKSRAAAQYELYVRNSQEKYRAQFSATIDSDSTRNGRDLPKGVSSEFIHPQEVKLLSLPHSSRVSPISKDKLVNISKNVNENLTVAIQPVKKTRPLSEVISSSATDLHLQPQKELSFRDNQLYQKGFTPYKSNKTENQSNIFTKPGNVPYLLGMNKPESPSQASKTIQIHVPEAQMKPLSSRSLLHVDTRQRPGEAEYYDNYPFVPKPQPSPTSAEVEHYSKMKQIHTPIRNQAQNTQTQYSLSHNNLLSDLQTNYIAQEQRIYENVFLSKSLPVHDVNSRSTDKLLSSDKLLSEQKKLSSNASSPVLENPLQRNQKVSSLQKSLAKLRSVFDSSNQHAKAVSVPDLVNNDLSDDVYGFQPKTSISHQRRTITPRLIKQQKEVKAKARIAADEQLHLITTEPLINKKYTHLPHNSVQNLLKPIDPIMTLQRSASTSSLERKQQSSDFAGSVTYRRAMTPVADETVKNLAMAENIKKQLIVTAQQIAVTKKQQTNALKLANKIAQINARQLANEDKETFIKTYLTTNETTTTSKVKGHLLTSSNPNAKLMKNDISRISKVGKISLNDSSKIITQMNITVTAKAPLALNDCDLHEPSKSKVLANISLLKRNDPRQISGQLPYNIYSANNDNRDIIVSKKVETKGDEYGNLEEARNKVQDAIDNAIKREAENVLQVVNLNILEQNKAKTRRNDVNLSMQEQDKANVLKNDINVNVLELDKVKVLRDDGNQNISDDVLISNVNLNVPEQNKANILRNEINLNILEQNKANVLKNDSLMPKKCNEESILSKVVVTTSSSAELYSIQQSDMSNKENIEIVKSVKTENSKSNETLLLRDVEKYCAANETVIIPQNETLIASHRREVMSPTEIREKLNLERYKFFSQTSSTTIDASAKKEVERILSHSNKNSFMSQTNATTVSRPLGTNELFSPISLGDLSDGEMTDATDFTIDVLVKHNEPHAREDFGLHNELSNSSINTDKILYEVTRRKNDDSTNVQQTPQESHEVSGKEEKIARRASFKDLLSSFEAKTTPYMRSARKQTQGDHQSSSGEEASGPVAVSGDATEKCKNVSFSDADEQNEIKQSDPEAAGGVLKPTWRRF